MAKQLGKFKGDTPRLITDDVGKMTFSINADSEFRYIMQNLIQEARRLDKDEKTKLVITVQEYKQTRSVEQNAMMWALLETLAEHQNGGRTGGVTPMDCYVDMLEKYGAKIDYFECLPQAIDSLRELFRVVQIIENRESNGKQTMLCKCVHGSSKYDTQEMSLLVEGILDTLAEHGIDGSEVAYQREEFYSGKSVRHSAKR